MLISHTINKKNITHLFNIISKDMIKAGIQIKHERLEYEIVCECNTVDDVERQCPELFY